ncbi:hypothetical protein [Frankia sp. QA3]|uniref:VMAP-C domain-containing protein n=1 Tax=Frankia sp. QA3 TaxID=710111 RepID=UPI000269B96E|nr:hypothetical protein [Frankia sp. QA3]EIV90733.1 hypothetical protein FraQA3DRAFT_0131 [Frankia sp. QA3]
MPHRFTTLRQRAELDLVRTLETCTAVTDEGGLRLLQDYVQDGVAERLQPRRQLLPGLVLRELVRLCVKLPDGLAALAAAVEFVGDEPTARAVRLRVAELDALAALEGELSVADWLMLRECLQGRVLADAARVAYEITADRLPRPLAEHDTLWHLFIQLAPCNAAPGQAPPWLVFLRFAAARLDPPAGARLELLVQTTAERWDLPEPAAQPHPGPPADPRSPAPDLAAARPAGEEPTAHLMIQIEPAAARPDQMLVSSWRQWDLGPWRPVHGGDLAVAASELQATVEQLIVEMEGQWDAPGTRDDATRARELTVEFILPDDLFGLPVEAWTLESGSFHPVVLGLAYPVVIRSLRRLRSRHWGRLWANRWRLVEGPGPNGARPRAHHSAGRGADRIRLLDAALRADEIVCLVLSAPPGGPDTHGGREVELALRAGCPVMLWHRSDCFSPLFREEVSGLLADGDFLSLPRRVLERRRIVEARMAASSATANGSPTTAREAPGTPNETNRTWDDEPAGFQLALLWDDPRRRPDVPAG